MDDTNNLNNKAATPFAQTNFHVPNADLNVGDLIKVGFNSNFGQKKNAKYIFLTATLDTAIYLKKSKPGLW